jgi:hypothetical protein
MRPRKRVRLLAAAALGTVLFVMASATGVDAQGHDDHHGGGHDDHGEHDGTDEHHGNTTTTGGNSSTSETSPPQPGSQTSKIRYGPFSVQGAPANPEPGMPHGHAHTGNRFSLFIRKPCTNCYVTGMTANLVYADGRTAGWNTDAQLHHMVLLAGGGGKTDATCAVSLFGLLGQRFFASGDERTPIIAPPGYGYFVGRENWHMIWELANHNVTPQNGLHIEMTYNWVPATTPGMTRLEPVWLDMNQCGTSEIRVPQGPSTRTYNWTVNRPGRVIGAGGHVHDGGINLNVATNGQVWCDSRARYGGSPLYTGHHGEAHLSGMGVCTGTRENPVTTLTRGQRVTMTGNYDMPAAVTDQMGIFIVYIDQT